jgi:N-acetylglucosamine malate deacetylase 1
MKPFDILAFSPHPDDVELSCGGSLILAADLGLRTAVADLTDGEGSSRGTPEQRSGEKAKAAQLLGLVERFSIGLPDTRIGLHADHREPLIELIRTLRPRVVLAPYWVDRHPDHEASGQLVRAACYYAGVATVGNGKPHRPERVYYYMSHTPFTPSFVVDITAVWDRKQDGIAAYATQFYDAGPELIETALSRPEFMRCHEARAVFFGAMIGAQYGEPFHAPGPIACRMLPGLEHSQPCREGLPPYCLF